MKLRKFLFLFLLLGVFLLSCKNYILLDSGGVRPKNLNFTYKKYSTSNGCSLVDTNAIYVFKFADSLNKSIDYSYYRFFSNGKLFCGIASQRFPESKDFNNFNSGSVGYYFCDGNEIHLEIFGLFFGDVQYVKFVGQINQDTILVSKSILTSFIKHKFQYNYVKVKPVEQLRGLADW